MSSLSVSAAKASAITSYDLENASPAIPRSAIVKGPDVEDQAAMVRDGDEGGHCMIESSDADSDNLADSMKGSSLIQVMFVFFYPAFFYNCEYTILSKVAINWLLITAPN